MKKVNFDSFKRIHASEELIQKTLAISEETEQKAVILPWYRRTNMIAAAAGIVLAAAIGLLSYYVFRKNDLPVKRAPMTDEAAETADPTIANKGTGSGDHPETADPSVGQNTTRDRFPQPETQIATDSNGKVIIIPVVPNRDATERSSFAVPGTEPATKRSSPTNENIFVRPSEGSREIAPTDPAEPSVEPLTEETREPEPWEPIDPSELPGDMTEAQTDATLTFRVSISAKLLPQSGRIYCRIYDRKRKIVLGNADRFHESHRASYTVSGTQLEITYCPSEHGITVPPGDYAIGFHDENGKLLIGYHQTVT